MSNMNNESKYCLLLKPCVSKFQGFSSSVFSGQRSMSFFLPGENNDS